MSKRNKRRPQANKPTIVTQERPQEQRREPRIRPGATNFVPLSDSILQAMYHNMGPQKNVDAMYAPGAPLRPMPGLTPVTGIRGWDYSVGHNIGKLPRATEIYSFADLRALSSTYYGVQMCQQVWFDYISQLELDIQPRKDLIGEDGDISQFESDIAFYKDFFSSPDRDHDLHSWLQMAVKDQLEIDAVCIYPRKDRAGRLYSLDLIDAAMITPLVDDRGRKPLPPFPAYEQYVHGIPAALLTSEDLIYIKETERTDSVYGRSRVEKIILNINIALRKQTKDLAHFTDGNLPPGFIQPSMDVQWSQDEIEAWEMQLNNVLAGNDELRARLKVLPRGFEYQSVTSSDDIHAELDQLILNITAACHGLTMAELAFVADINRANGDAQENVVYRRAMGPLMKRYARLFTMILHKYFKDKRFIVSFRGYEETEDIQSNATAYSTLTGAGILGISEAAKLMKLPEDPDAPKIGRLIITKDGPIFLDDMASDEIRQAQLKAKLAGLDMATNPPPQAPADDEHSSDEKLQENAGKEDEEEESPAVKRLMAQVQEILARLDRTEVTRAETIPKHTGIMVAFMLNPEIASQLALPDGEPVEDMHLTLAFLGDSSNFTGNIEALKQTLASFAYSAVPLTGTLSGVGRFNPGEGGISPVYASVNVSRLHHTREQLVHTLELTGYQLDHTHEYTPHITLAYIPADAPMPVSSVPPLPLRFDTIWLCVGDERFSFPFGKLPGTSDDTEKRIADLRAQGVTRVTWKSRCMCDVCTQNNHLVRALGVPFPSGHRLGPCHDECPCEMEYHKDPPTEREIVEELKKWRSCAVHDVKDGRKIRSFVSNILPTEIRDRIASELEACLTVGDVRIVFDRVKETMEESCKIS